MTATENLFAAYLAWRQLADNEGQAIRAGDWTQVQQCQESLRKLQPEILRHTQDARADWQTNESELTEREDQLRRVIGELIELERRNSSWLSEARSAADAEWMALQQTGNTLRQVQRSYAPPRAPVWTSFS